MPAFRVTRVCCLHGQCTECIDLPYGVNRRVEHVSSACRETAELILKNWAAYQPLMSSTGEESIA